MIKSASVLPIPGIFINSNADAVFTLTESEILTGQSAKITVYSLDDLIVQTIH